MLRRLARKAVLGALARGISPPSEAFDKVQETIHLRNLLQRLEINCVVDVGANEGQSVALLRGLGFKGHIFSFEPLARAYATLEQSFGSDPYWKGARVALGERSGSQTLHVNPESTVMSSLLRPLHPHHSMQLEEVRVVTLDSLFPALVEPVTRPRVLLKIDTEGYDLRVFRGAAKSLPYIFAMQVELYVRPVYRQTPHYLQALQEYEEAGFKPVNVSVVSRTASGDVEVLNCLMKRGRGG